MKIIKPIAITDAMITSCNIAENDYAAWSAATSYVIDNRCLYNHKIYKCIAPNTDKQPDLNSWGTEPVWLDEGYSNRWRMLDGEVGSQTTATDFISITLLPGEIADSLALIDLGATAINITMTDPVEGVVYSDSIDLVSKTNISDGFEYFFAPIITESAVAILGMPPYPNASITIEIENPSGIAGVGLLIIGNQRDAGFTQYNPSISITDYSSKTTDVFGKTTVIKRAFAKTMSVETMLKNSEVDYLQSMLAEYRAEPVVWIGADSRFAAMVIYGYYKNFTITIPYPDEATCTIEVEGLI